MPGDVASAIDAAADGVVEVVDVAVVVVVVSVVPDDAAACEDLLLLDTTRRPARFKIRVILTDGDGVAC